MTQMDGLWPMTQFLRYCLDEKLELPESAKRIDWRRMMAWAEQQAVVGVIYGGIQRAGKSLGIPFDVLMEWIGYGQNIELRNRLVNQRCVEVVDEFRDAGYECCVLKGQGNAMMYPNAFLRNPGDIDLWVVGHTEITEITERRPTVGDREVIRFVRGRNPGAKAVYHHVDYGMYKEVEVEVHYRPTFMNNLIVNRKLQRWMKGHSDATEIKDMPEGVGRIRVPNWEFNVVFQLSHIYRHVIQSGLGLRQIIDYYYLLKGHTEITEITERRPVAGEGHTDSTDDTDFRPMAEMEGVLKHLGLMEIAGAVMWVLKEVLGLEDRYLIAPVDERRGTFLLEEIMEGGNFGMWLKPDTGWLNGVSAIGKNILRLKRDIRLVRYFPSECLWEPVFRIWHFGWRVVHKF